MRRAIGVVIGLCVIAGCALQKTGSPQQVKKDSGAAVDGRAVPSNLPPPPPPPPPAPMAAREKVADAKSVARGEHDARLAVDGLNSAQAVSSRSASPSSLAVLKSLGYVSSTGAGPHSGAYGGVVGGVVGGTVSVVGGEEQPSTESYSRVDENAFLDAVRDPLSTFSIDVDTAGYTNVRRFLTQGERPPKDAVRIEELLNFFSFDDPLPFGSEPFAVHTETASCPWNQAHRLLRIGLRTAPIAFEHRQPGNYVFLIDVSGSMNEPNKLPLVKSALKLLAGQLTARDTIAIAVYAGNSGIALEPTSAANQSAVLSAIDQLEPGGSTNGAAGIRLAYDLARKSFVRGGVNRVILATDGDFNVGVSSEGELTRLIEEQAKSGVFLTVLGFGMGNLKDATLEKLADRGNGNYAYIDSEIEAHRALVEQAGGTLITVAKDVKVQIEFNPARVSAYRLIGYENRLLAAADFNDDTKDAGEIGAGLSVTALYEIEPATAGGGSTAAKVAGGTSTTEVINAGNSQVARSVDPLRYQKTAPTAAAQTGELATLKLRYKDPEGDTSRLLTFAVLDDGRAWTSASADLKFAAAVAGFGMLLRDSPHKGDATFDSIRALAQAGATGDRDGRRTEFLTLVDRARELAARDIAIAR